MHPIVLKGEQKLYTCNTSAPCKLTHTMLNNDDACCVSIQQQLVEDALDRTCPPLSLEFEQTVTNCFSKGSCKCPETE